MEMAAVCLKTLAPFNLLTKLMSPYSALDKNQTAFA
jgi:hypothetical protein